MLGEQVFALILAAMARGSSSNDSTVRLLNLVALLTEAQAPMTIAQIAEAMNDLEKQFRYPEKFEARRTMFIRDRKALEKLGIDIVMTTRGGTDAGKGEYIISKDSYSYIDFGLTQEELEALQIAAAVVQIEKPWGREAVQWLGGAVSEPPTGAVARVSAQSADLTALFAAIRAKAEVRFTYNNRERRLQPLGLVTRNGFWYLVGMMVPGSGEPEQRTFRVDRISGAVTVGDAGSFERPAGFDLESAIPFDPKKFGDGAAESATVRVDRNLVPGVVRELGEQAIITKNDDGSVDFSVPCGNRSAFRSWVFSMVDHAEVIAPAEVRQEIINELRSLAGAK